MLQVKTNQKPIINSANTYLKLCLVSISLKSFMGEICLADERYKFCKREFFSTHEQRQFARYFLMLPLISIFLIFTKVEVDVISHSLDCELYCATLFSSPSSSELAFAASFQVKNYCWYSYQLSRYDLLLFLQGCSCFNTYQVLSDNTQKCKLYINPI